MSNNLEVLLKTKEKTELFQPKDASPETSDARRPPMRGGPIGREEEAELVQRVFLLPAYEVPRVVVVCGVEHRDGTVGICARAGLNLANQTGLSVCVVDGDLYSPSLHKYF